MTDPAQRDGSPSPVSTVRLSCGLMVPRIGVGLAHLHLMPRASRTALIDGALASGLTHFDTAPFYGDGLSEATLGAVLGDRRRAATITTKFGLLPTPVIGRMGPFAPLGRKGRGVLRRLGLVEALRRSYAPATLRRSLATSLRALRTDYVDVLAIHEPSGIQGITDDTIEAMVVLRRSGATRFIGVAGDDVATAVARWGGVLDIVQTAEERWPGEGRAPDFTYGLFSHAAGTLDQAEAEHRLARALARRPDGAVIIQTRDPARLKRYIETSSR